jgi:hypothetical protein
MPNLRDDHLHSVGHLHPVYPSYSLYGNHNTRLSICTEKMGYHFFTKFIINTLTLLGYFRGYFVQIVELQNKPKSKIITFKFIYKIIQHIANISYLCGFGLNGTEN